MLKHTVYFVECLLNGINVVSLGIESLDIEFTN